MKADQATTEGYALDQTCMLDAAGESQIFDDLHAERFEAAGLDVGGTAEEVEGADAQGVAFGCWVGDAPGTGAPEGEYLKEPEDGGFVPAVDEGGGDGDEVVGAGGDRVAEGAADGVGAEEDVGVGEEEVVGGGLAGGEGHGVGLAEPAGREFGDVDGADSIRVLAGDGVDDRASLVGTAVVDGDDLEIGVVLLD